MTFACLIRIAWYIFKIEIMERQIIRADLEYVSFGSSQQSTNRQFDKSIESQNNKLLNMTAI